MQSLFRRTTTNVCTSSDQRQERERGMRAAGLASGRIQIGAQLILWLFFFGYDQTQQAVWQAAGLLLLPLFAVWLLWKNADISHPSAKWWTLPLVLCLLSDAVFLIAALGGFISQVLPTYPLWLMAVLPSALCFVTALCARPRGVQYGASLLAVLMIILLVVSTVFLRASSRADRLWPILGDGLLSTAKSALSGAGAAWGAALLFVIPKGDGQKTARWLVVPWALMMVFALWFGFLRPWAAGDDLAISEKMMGLARHAHSVILYEMSGILWMLLLPTALISCFSTGGQLFTRAFPRMPFGLALLVLPVLGTLAALLWADRLFDVLSAALPWRTALCLICGAGLLITQRRKT